MKKMISISYVLLFVNAFSFAQPKVQTPKTKVMPLGVFHFNYPNLDAVKVDKEDQISVLNEPYQSQILDIAQAIADFNPTIIAVELSPQSQNYIDSLYNLYLIDKYTIGKNEIFQLGFRIGKMVGATRIYCVDNPGNHYGNVQKLFSDSIRLSQLEAYHDSLKTVAVDTKERPKVKSILDELQRLNRPEYIKERLGVYLTGLFQYEETAGDFWGVDFETGRWFNRNLRIYRNLQRLPKKSDDRMLIIFGAEHLNLLNPFFEASPEFELVSPIPLLEKVKDAS